ncbi:MAG: hypothetical protein IID36_07255, partial [Planctomycetes bacterium]|nr:hypothetical protein [Planctomycetota bacterium]
MRRTIAALCCTVALAPPAVGNVLVTYEANTGVFPDEHPTSPWERTIACTPERWVEGDLLIQHVMPVDG